MNHEDFFAPRPQLSFGEKLIRVHALMFACLGSLQIWAALIGAWLNPSAPGWTNPTVEDIFRGFFQGTIVQTALLMVCWRSWMLRRWACQVVLWLGWILAVVFCGPSFALSIVAATFYSYRFGFVYPNLKPGF